MPSTIQPPIILLATSFTCVKYVVPTTVPSSDQIGTVSLSKLTSSTSLQPLILKYELCKYLKQAFVKWLINHLCHGCFIGYKGPRFSYCANNLLSAYQHPTAINVILEKECQLGRILGAFQYPLQPTF